ncbi:hypothetical protein Tco_0126157 [Tanacetum coccineum]
MTEISSITVLLGLQGYWSLLLLWFDRHMARDCPKNDENGGEGSGNDTQAATKGRVFDSTTNRAASASGTISGNSLSV